MITLRCKTDFALRTDVLQTLGNQLAMHVSAFGGFNPDASWLMDNSKKVKDVINEVAVQLGEPVVLEHVHVQGC
jgi:translation elongation factor EF-Ts